MTVHYSAVTSLKGKLTVFTVTVGEHNFNVIIIIILKYLLSESLQSLHNI